jgi:hypothetical protein
MMCEYGDYGTKLQACCSACSGWAAPHASTSIAMQVARPTSWKREPKGCRKAAVSSVKWRRSAAELASAVRRAFSGPSSGLAGSSRASSAVPGRVSGLWQVKQAHEVPTVTRGRRLLTGRRSLQGLCWKGSPNDHPSEAGHL